MARVRYCIREMSLTLCAALVRIMAAEPLAYAARTQRISVAASRFPRGDSLLSMDRP